MSGVLAYCHEFLRPLVTVIPKSQDTLDKMLRRLAIAVIQSFGERKWESLHAHITLGMKTERDLPLPCQAIVKSSGILT